MGGSIASVSFASHTRHILGPCHPGSFGSKSNHGALQQLHCELHTRWIRWADSHAWNSLGQTATRAHKQADSTSLSHQRVTKKRWQHLRVSLDSATWSVQDLSVEEVQVQLESLQQEAKEVQTRARSARARFMRLSVAAEQLRLQAALEVKAAREESAVRLLKDKQKVMQGLEMSKRRADVLDELYAKLNEAISRKEAQLIAALSCARLDLRNVQVGTADGTRVVLPPEPRINSEAVRTHLATDTSGGQQTAAAEPGDDTEGLLEDKVPIQPGLEDNYGDLPNVGFPEDGGEAEMVETGDLLQTESLPNSGKQEPAADDGLIYLGDVDITEEKEEPPTYVPPPPVAAEDTDMRNHVETLLYTLKDVLPGTMVKNQERCSAALALFSDAVEFQDPFFCFRGIDRLQSFLSILAESGAGVNLHEIYYESLVKHRFKRWVYCVMTVTLVEDLGEALPRLGLLECWNEKHHALMMEQLQPGQERVADTGTGIGRDEPASLARELNLSGELKFEMDNKGKVSNVNSTWYVMEDEGEVQLAEAKLWLSLLLSSHAS